MSTLRDAEIALRQAQLAGDIESLDRLLADELTFTGPDGLLYGKRDDLDAYRAGAIRITKLEPSEEHVQDFGELAVVSVRMEMRGSFQGADFGGPFRYTRIWRRTDSGWRIVAGHVSPITGGESTK
jgi:ketosteroid isomerase-like protein